MGENDIRAWLQQRGGQSNVSRKQEAVENTNRTSRTDPEKIARTTITYTAKNGEKLVVVDEGKMTEGPSSNAEGGDSPLSQKVYTVIGEGREPSEARTDPRSPEKQAEEAELARERAWNRDAGSGRYESHTERATRERADENQNFQRENQARAGRNEERGIDAANRATDQQAVANQLGRDKFDADRDQQGVANALARDRYSLDRDKMAADEARANRPNVLGVPKSDEKQIAVFNPATGQVEAQANPLYDQARTESARMIEDLKVGIQLNQISADQAKDQYQRWFKETVEVPFLMAAERRAQATEQRQAAEAAERSRQFAASHEMSRAQLGQTAARDRVGAEMQMLPYRVGSSYAGEMSSAINSLAKGGKMGNSPSEGIKFTPGSFKYKAPDIDKIAAKATAKALSSTTTYTPSDKSEFPTGDYSGLPLPTPDMMAGAPQAAPLDVAGMWGRYQGVRGGEVPIDDPTSGPPGISGPNVNAAPVGAPSPYDDPSMSGFK